MSQTITQVVREKYAAVASSGLTNESAGVQAVAEAFGYSAEELQSIPAEANMGLSCGNPTATAHLKPGEVVVDLGSGGGLDVFLAAKNVGPTGKAIGIDMTPEMVERATRNAEKQGLGNVEFHLATIDKTPLPDGTADCVISNCVINLADDKAAVFREIFRILKPGGRVAVSDIALKKELPPEVGQDLMAYVGCIAGAVLVRDYEAGLKAAGFSAVQVVDTKKDLNAYAKVEGQGGCCSPVMTAPTPAASACCTPAPAGSSECCVQIGSEKPIPEVASDCCTPNPVHGGLSELISRYDINEFAASVQVYAVKPS